MLSAGLNLMQRKRLTKWQAADDGVGSAGGGTGGGPACARVETSVW